MSKEIDELDVNMKRHGKTTAQHITSHTDILVQEAYDRGYADKSMKVEKELEMKHSPKGCTAPCHQMTPIEPTNFTIELAEIIYGVETGRKYVKKGVHMPQVEAITLLIKELVAEAKPKTMPSNLSPENYEKCERVVNQYHQNLLKALEEV